MKLLYITNGINGSGGLERVLSIKASYLADKYNYEVSILVLNNTHLDSFYEFSPKINFHSIQVFGNPLQYISNYKSGIQRVVSEIHPDIISVCDDGLKAFFIPQFLKTNARIIYERHVSKLIEAKSGQNYFKNFLTKSKWLLMENLAKKFSKFVVLTDGNKKEWKTLNNLEVIPNPLSFYPSQTSSLEEKTVICVGKISYQKGQDLLIKAWEKVFERYPDWKLEMYGKENIFFLNTEGLSQNIFWFPPAKDIDKKYLNSSIYVMSSRFEGFGMVLIEAMACGVPCISFNCDYGPSDIIKDNEDGFLVSNGNVEELAKKILTLIENTELRKEFGQRSKENVRRFEVDVILEKWNQLFKTLKN